MSAATRMSAEERREAVLDVALPEFAKGGLAGTSTETIAERAGISQPYLFRLFPTKKALFIACLRRGFERVERRFVEASAGLTGAEALMAMGLSYDELLHDRQLLLSQLQAYAACGDGEVQAAVRDCFGHLWRVIEARSGASDDEIRQFFAMGMLCNVLAALDIVKSHEAWAQSALPDAHRMTAAHTTAVHTTGAHTTERAEVPA